MDFQVSFNIAVGLVGALGGYVLKSVSENLKSLQQADTVLTDKVQKVEVLVAGQYVTQDAMSRLSAALFAKLDKIENKLDSKQDKP